jgi:DNA-directed RNA polymerase subunit beta
MVDINAYVDFDCTPLGIKERVCFDVLSEILDSCESEEDLKREIELRAGELVPNHITTDDIFASVNYMNCLAEHIGNTDKLGYGQNTWEILRTGEPLW